MEFSSHMLHAGFLFICWHYPHCTLHTKSVTIYKLALNFKHFGLLKDYIRAKKFHSPTLHHLKTFSHNNDLLKTYWFFSSLKNTLQKTGNRFQFKLKVTSRFNYNNAPWLMRRHKSGRILFRKKRFLRNLPVIIIRFSVSYSHGGSSW
jgi:hypothetical protein